ncbi:MAG TPA: immune inhibitor A domain-containing protein [Agromyces sp.]
MRSRTVALSAGFALVAGLSFLPAGAAAGADAMLAEPVAASTLPAAECKLTSPLWQYNEGFAIDEAAAAATGTLTVQAIYADFPDHRGGGEGEFWFDHLHFDATQAAANLETQSGGRLDVVVREPGEWVTLPNDTTAYPHDGDAGWSNRIFHEFVTDAITAAEPTIDFTGADVVWVFFPSAPPLPTRAQADNFVPLTPDGPVFRAITIPKVGSDAAAGAVLVHETGHTFGFPDLYDTAVPGGASTFLGAWDPMSDGWGDGAELEAWEFMGWHVWRLGWIDDHQVNCIAPSSRIDVTLDALTRRGDSVIAVVPTGAHRAIVVESRKAERFNTPILRPGVLITVVDTELASGDGPVRVAPRDGTAFPITPEQFEDVTLLPGERYTDPVTGLTATVLASTESSDTVRIVWPDAPTAPPTTPEPVVPAAEAATAGAATLPATGLDPATTVGTAALLLLTGAVALIAARLRHATATRREGSH